MKKKSLVNLAISNFFFKKEIQKKDEIMHVVKELVYQEKFKNSVRLLGISFSNLDTEKKAPVWVQLKLEF